MSDIKTLKSAKEYVENAGIYGVKGKTFIQFISNLETKTNIKSSLTEEDKKNNSNVIKEICRITDEYKEVSNDASDGKSHALHQNSQMGDSSDTEMSTDKKTKKSVKPKRESKKERLSKIDSVFKKCIRNELGIQIDLDLPSVIENLYKWQTNPRSESLTEEDIKREFYKITGPKTKDVKSEDVGPKEAISNHESASSGDDKLVSDDDINE